MSDGQLIRATIAALEAHLRFVDGTGLEATKRSAQALGTLALRDRDVRWYPWETYRHDVGAPPVDPGTGRAAVSAPSGLCARMTASEARQFAAQTTADLCASVAALKDTAAPLLSPADAFDASAAATLDGDPLSAARRIAAAAVQLAVDDCVVKAALLADLAAALDAQSAPLDLPVPPMAAAVSGDDLKVRSYAAVSSAALQRRRYEAHIDDLRGVLLVS